jgi:hypothetical protein
MTSRHIKSGPSKGWFVEQCRALISFWDFRCGPATYVTVLAVLSSSIARPQFPGHSKLGSAFLEFLFAVHFAITRLVCSKRGIATYLSL